MILQSSYWNNASTKPEIASTKPGNPAMSSCLWWAINYYCWGETYEEVEEEQDSPQLELLWLQLRARSRGTHRTVRALVADAKDTTHFSRHSEHDIIRMVYGH